MPETARLQAALQELDLLRQREALALRDSRATFAVLDALRGHSAMGTAIAALLDVVRHEFGANVVVLCRVAPETGHITFLQQTGSVHLPDVNLQADAALLTRPCQLGDLGIIAPDGGLEPMRCAILAPLSVPQEKGLAILCLSDKAAAFLHADLMRLTQMVRVAAEPLAALRLAQRNADLAALIDGRLLPREDGLDDLDPSYRAVNHAVDRLTQVQAVTVDILNRLLTAQSADLDGAIQQAIAQMGRHCGMDRVYVFEVTGPHRVDCTYEWVSADTPTMKDQMQNMPQDLIPDWFNALSSGQDVHVADVDALPPGSPEKAFLQAQHVRSLVVTPMMDNSRFEGFVGYDAVRAPRIFLQGEVFLLRAICNAIGAMLRKRRDEVRVLKSQQELDLERARLSATLNALPDLVIELDATGRFRQSYSHGDTGRERIANQLLGRTMREALSAELADAGHRMLIDVATTRHTEAHTFQYDIGGGDLRWIRAHAAQREAPTEGGPLGYLFVLRDITREVDQARDIALLGEVAKRTSNLVVVTDRAGKITWVNSAFEAASGWTLTDVLGKVPGHFLQPKDVDPAAITRIREALIAGLPVKEELLNVSRHGRPYWISLDIQPLQDTAGTVTGFIAVETDITEAKTQSAALAAAAEAAKQAQDRLIAAVESLEDGFVFFDAAGKMVICNERYRNIAPGFADILVPGVTLEQIFRRGLLLGTYQDAIGREEEWLAHRLSEHRRRELTVEQRLSDGRWIRIFDKATPDGGRVGLRVDITALKEAEARALSDRAAAMDAAHDGMAITAPDGTFLYANPAFLAMVGKATAAAVLGKSWVQVLGAEVQADLDSRALPGLAKSGDKWRGVLERRTDEATRSDIEVSLSRRGDGALVWVLRDLTERRAAEVERNRLREDLQIAQRREVIGQLAAGLAHDFNNLIAAISGSATLILDDDGTGAPQRAKEHALRIQKSAERAEAMVRKLLALGTRPSSQKKTDLVPVLREAADLLRPGLGHSVRLLLEFPTEPLTTTLETTDVLQIVLNLGINARDAMMHAPRADVQSRILIGLRRAETAEVASCGQGGFWLGSVDPNRGYACLTVTDTGPGISDCQAERIFAPYFSTKGDKGSGLGLSIVAGVVKAAGGAIGLKQADGGGAVFTVLLPLVVSGARRAKAPARSNAETLTPRPDRAAAPVHRSQPLQGRNILIVDDEEDVLSVLAALLERAGAEVAPTSDPEVAYEVLREDPDAFDLVVTDFDMGSMTGADLARAAHEARPDLPVLLITALPDWQQRDAHRGVDPSFFKVLGKPVSSEALVATAVRAVDSSRN